MPYSLEGKLVVAISSRALFDLDMENAIYEKEGLTAYSAYQIAHENEILTPGAGFSLIQALLAWNEIDKDHPKVEVIIVSRNSADTGLRIFHSLSHYQIPIVRSIFSGGAPLAAYLHALSCDLFLSAHAKDVQEAINANIAAGLLMTQPHKEYVHKQYQQVRIAFDGDAVLFSDESERIYQSKGLQAFLDNESTKKDVALPAGPFAHLLKTISTLQKSNDQLIRTALVTARNAPAHERVIKTLRAWNVRIDEVCFLGGLEKRAILEAFGADIFFDDQDVHVLPASEVTLAAKVPYKND